MGAAVEPQAEALPEEPEVQAAPVAEASQKPGPVVQAEAAAADVAAAEAAPASPGARRRPVGDSAFRRLDAPQGEPDDLQKISGVGKVMATS